MDLGILVPLSPFIMVIAIVWFNAWQKDRARKEIQATLRAAIEKGQPLPVDVVESMSAEIHRPASASRDLRLGIILIATAAGIGLTAWVLSYFADEAGYAIGAFGAIPATIGLAFVILSFFNKNKD